MKIRYAAKTDVGMKRTHNEDYFSLIEDEQLFIVADGMGGHASGEVASKMAAETIGEFYQRTREDEDVTWPYKMDRSLSYVENRLVCAIKLAEAPAALASIRKVGRLAAAGRLGQGQLLHVVRPDAGEVRLAGVAARHHQRDGEAQDGARHRSQHPPTMPRCRTASPRPTPRPPS